jgi:hypothetical protein
MRVQISIPVVECNSESWLYFALVPQFFAELPEWNNPVVLLDMTHLRFKDAWIETRKKRSSFCPDPVVAEDTEF